MIRTQIQLTEEQAQALRRLAAERGVSIAELVRQAVDRVLADRPEAALRARLVASLGGFHSGRSDISEEHDRYLAEAFED